MAKKKQGNREESTAAAARTETPTAGKLGDDEVSALVERLRLGRCVLCAGSRLDDGAGSFRDLVGKLLSGLPDLDSTSKSDAERVLRERPLAAAGFVRRRLGDRFAGQLLGALPVFATSDTLQILGALPFRAVVTTTYADTFEKTFTTDGVAPRVYTPADSLELKKDGKARFVFKALGDPSRAETVVWSAEDLQGALSDGGYRAVTHDLYRSRSFLFLGFEGADPDLGILLERVLSGAKAGDVEHFAVLPGLSAIEKEELYAAYRIKVLDVADSATLALQLKEAIGDQLGPILPDDDDLDGWLTILTDEPGRSDALDRLDALERKLKTENDHERLVDLYLGRVGVEPDAQRRGGFLVSVGHIFENEVGDLQKAFTAFLAAYKEAPQPETWNQLERLASATGMWTELLSELAEVVPQLGEEERASAWVRIGRLYGDKLGHVEYALTSLDEALKISPDHEEAEELRIQLLRRAERWIDLAPALGKRATRSLAGAAERAELLLEQADILENRIGDGAAAVLVYREALAADPSSDDARAALEALLRRRSAFAELLPLLDEKARVALPDESIMIRREAAEMCAERRGDRKGASERYEALRADSPRDLPTLRALERLYQQDGRQEEFLRVLSDQADAVESDKERAALYRRIATEWEESPGGSTRASEFLEKLLVLDAKSEDAFRSLERLYRSDRRWQELVDIYRRHAAIVPGPIRGELFAQVGAIYAEELNDPLRAIEAFTDVDTALPNHAEALLQLSKLYEKTESWDKAVETLERRATLAEVRSQKVELLFAAGTLTAERIGDSKQAETRFVKVLELDANYAAAMTALVEIYRKNGEFLKAAKLLVEAVPHTPNRLERTRLLVEAGEIFDGLDDHKKATELYLEALGVDPDHVEAGERVAELLWKAERWKELLPILEMLTRVGSRAQVEPHVQVERLLRLARAATSLNEPEKVQKAYVRAAELDPTNLEAQRGRAQQPFAKGDWKEAHSALELIAKHHAADLPPSERVELFHQLGVVELKLEKKPQAKEWFGKALDIDPSHRPSLLAMMEFGEVKPESMIDAKKALLVTAPLEEQLRLYGEIGDLYLDKLSDRVQALSSYREALELRPEEKKFLHKCLDIYSEDKQWPQAVEMLERLIEIEKSPTMRAKYRHAGGLICRDELGRSEQAAKMLSEALDDDPTMDRSAESLEELLKERQEWKELARFYRKQLKRIGPETGDGRNDERLRLWSATGELYLDKLGERESALAALEVALSFDRNNIDRHKQLADLYIEAGPDRFDKAIIEHQYLLKAEKNRVVSYRALKMLYAQTGARDKATACSYALTFLKKGEADDQKAVAEYKARPFATARRALNDEMWGRLVHPDEDRLLLALFTIIGPVTMLASAQPHKNFGLNRKEALEVNDPRPFNKAFRYVGATLGLTATLPEVYIRPEQKEAVQFLSCIDKQVAVPVFLVGHPFLVDKRPERDFIFDLGRRLAMMRPERLLRYALPDVAQLAHLVEATMTLTAEKDGEKPILSPEMTQTTLGLKRMLTPVQQEQIFTIARKLKGQRPTELVTAWLKATDLTGSRAGLAVAGDLETSARIVAADAASAQNHPTLQRLLDLVWSSVTEDVFVVRKHLGTI